MLCEGLVESVARTMEAHHDDTDIQTAAITTLATALAHGKNTVGKCNRLAYGTGHKSSQDCMDIDESAVFWCDVSVLDLVCVHAVMYGTFLGQNYIWCCLWATCRLLIAAVFLHQSAWPIQLICRLRFSFAVRALLLCTCTYWCLTCWCSLIYLYINISNHVILCLH